MADAPGQRQLSDKEIEGKKINKLTPQTSNDFKSFMNKLGATEIND